MLPRLEVPAHLHRNSPTVSVFGYEETGLALIRLATERLGLDTLAHSDVLDIGCGVRFTQTIVNRDVPIKSYTGIEVYRPVVDFMREHVEPLDARFRFAHWDVSHGFYNAESTRLLTDEAALPLTGPFDVIWLFSVFTHLDAGDARAMLTLMRRAIRPGGQLLFTAFIDADLDGCESRGPLHPLHMVFYGPRTLERLIEETGWEMRSFYPGGPQPFIQPCFRCTPKD